MSNNIDNRWLLTSDDLHYLDDLFRPQQTEVDLVDMEDESPCQPIVGVVEPVPSTSIMDSEIPVIVTESTDRVIDIFNGGQVEPENNKVSQVYSEEGQIGSSLTNDTLTLQYEHINRRWSHAELCNRKYYKPEFLLFLRTHPESIKKHKNLPDVSAVLKDGVNKIPESDKSWGLGQPLSCNPVIVERPDWQAVQNDFLTDLAIFESKLKDFTATVCKGSVTVDQICIDKMQTLSVTLDFITKAVFPHCSSSISSVSQLESGEQNINTQEMLSTKSGVITTKKITTKELLSTEARVEEQNIKMSKSEEDSCTDKSSQSQDNPSIISRSSLPKKKNWKCKNKSIKFILPPIQSDIIAQICLVHQSNVFAIQQYLPGLYRCLICQMLVNGHKNVAEHVMGRTHVETIRKDEKLDTLMFFNNMWKNFTNKYHVNKFILYPGDKELVLCEVCKTAVPSDKTNLLKHMTSPGHINNPEYVARLSKMKELKIIIEHDNETVSPTVYSSIVSLDTSSDSLSSNKLTRNAIVSSNLSLNSDISTTSSTSSSIRNQNSVEANQKRRGNGSNLNKKSKNPVSPTNGVLYVNGKELLPLPFPKDSASPNKVQSVVYQNSKKNTLIVLPQSKKNADGDPDNKDNVLLPAGYEMLVEDIVKLEANPTGKNKKKSSWEKKKVQNNNDAQGGKVSEINEDILSNRFDQNELKQMSNTQKEKAIKAIRRSGNRNDLTGESTQSADIDEVNIEDSDSDSNSLESDDVAVKPDHKEVKQLGIWQGVKEVDLINKMLIREQKSSLHCTVCNSYMNKSTAALVQHIQLKHHQKALANVPVRYFCSPCRLLMTDLDIYTGHRQSEEHAESLVKLCEDAGGSVTLSEFPCLTCRVVVFGRNEEGGNHQHFFSMNPVQVKGRMKKTSQYWLPAKARALLSDKMQLMDVTYKLADVATRVMRQNDKDMQLCRALENTLRREFPNCRAYPFGSRVSGLGNEDSDLDIFLDTGNMYSGRFAQDNKSQADFVQKSYHLLLKESQWDGLEAVYGARTPIVKVYNTRFLIDCDVSFRNGLSVENTILLWKMMELQPLSRHMLLVIKKWCDDAKLHRLSSYAICVMGMFMLQVQGHLPSVYELMQGPPKLIIGNWECQIGLPHKPVKPITQSLPVLVKDFFKFYTDVFNYEREVVCPLLGKSIQKSCFESPDLLPPEMRQYAEHLLRTPEATRNDPNSRISKYVVDHPEKDEFRYESPLCVQDPFDLSHNLTKALQEKDVMRLKKYFELSYKIML